MSKTNNTQLKPETGIAADTFAFLKALSRNNNKAWFDAHRTAYETARDNVIVFLESLLARLGQTDDTLRDLTAKACLFRINRDVRFAKDKSPYKQNFGASMTRGGKKSPFAGYYFHLEPGASFIGGGLWMPGPEQLYSVRQEIDYNFEEFKEIIHQAAFRKQFSGLYEGEGMKLQRLPKGYESDNPAAEFLKLKSFIVMKPMTDKEVLSTALLERSEQALLALHPMIRFINRAIAD